MNKSKLSLSKTKTKPKLPTPLSTTNKSVFKNKQKMDRISPRSNRMHTLQTKKSIEIPRKNKAGIQMSPLYEKNINNNDHGKGYETPKFKCEIQVSPKKTTVAHNFFSFGEKQREKELLKQLTNKMREPQKTFLSKTRQKCMRNQIR